MTTYPIRGACLLLALACAVGAAETPWPAEVAGFVAPAAGEHPRLFFRESDLPALRKKAGTEVGKAILERLKRQLDGGDGTTPPPDGMWSISHVAGYGFLYQITGDQVYADAGRAAMEQSLAGVKHGKEKRYGFRAPNGALRAGPSLGWHALGYDLCYDGWDESFRNRVRDELMNYNEGKNMSLDDLAVGSRHGPHSNHWGMQIGGAALTLLALHNDPGVDNARIESLMKKNSACFIRKLTEGYGDGGYFKEGDGTGSMGYIAFIPAMQAWRIAGGQDFVTPRPNGQWITRRWLLGTVPRGSELHFHKRDGYSHNVWSRDGISGGNYFGIGFGLFTPEEQAAWLWFYEQHLRERDEQAGTPYDTCSFYPHHSVLSFVNWPLDVEPVNPAEVLPRASLGSTYSYGMFRNRWQDADDIVITFLGQRPRKHTKDHEIGAVWITAFGEDERWGSITGKVRHSHLAEDGSGIVQTDGGCIAIDFSGSSGAPGMIALIGSGVPADALDCGGTPIAFRFLIDGTVPTPSVAGDQVTIGRQTVSVVDGRIVLGVIAPAAGSGG